MIRRLTMQKNSSEQVSASAPGKIIIFGEHSVTDGKLGVACAVGKRCFVTVKPTKENCLVFDAKDLNIKHSLTPEELSDFFKRITDISNNTSLTNQQKFETTDKIDKEEKLPPSLFIVATILDQHGFVPMEIEIRSEIPKNLGSSSAAFAAISLAVLTFLGKSPTKKEISDLAYIGDVLAHGRTPSGIDNNAVTHGKYIKYTQSEGPVALNIDFEIPLLIVDSGEKAETAKTVLKIQTRQQKEREQGPSFVDKVFYDLDKISRKSLKKLMARDFSALGQLMTEYYNTLWQLDISTPDLDKIVQIALEENALGAKPTGGWGGGCCLVLTKDEEQRKKLIQIFRKNGYDAFEVVLGVEGVRKELA